MPRGFPSPFQVQTPPECQGWEELYPHYLLFSHDRREEEEARFWFWDSMHYPQPLAPFEVAVAEAGNVGGAEMGHRVFVLPAGKGWTSRVLLGYLYVSPTPITDPQEIERRTAYFTHRAGHYLAQWDEAYSHWKQKVIQETRALESISLPPLPEVEDDQIVLERRGVGVAPDLLRAYHTLLESLYRVWQLHSEIVLVGFAEYFTFYQFCRQAFPEIPDAVLPRMLCGTDVAMFRPHEEVKRLAQLAVELAIHEVFSEPRSPAEVWADLERTDAGRRWLREWQRSLDPWFAVTPASGLHHSHRAWRDDPSPVLAVLPTYIQRIQAGASVDRPAEKLAEERDRITAAYRQLLPSEEERRAFDEMVALTRRVYHAIEDHKFYVDQWYQTVFWNKVREFGRLFVSHGFLDHEEQVFYLKPREVEEALHELLLAWSTGCEPRGRRYWLPLVQRRQAIHQALHRVKPPLFLGQMPQEVTDPAIVMLWGFTGERIRQWFGSQEEEEGNVLRGVSGAPGVAEGPARVVLTAEDLHAVQPGEVLVCPVTEPSWAPVFTKITATVSDIGGIMSHAAIVAREYGIPAVLGTGHATQRIRTGQRVRVDGDAGTVTILG